MKIEKETEELVEKIREFITYIDKNKINFELMKSRENFALAREFTREIGKLDEFINSRFPQVN